MFSSCFVSQGLLSAIPLSYILPGLIFLKLDPQPLFSREKLPAIALVVFGLIVSISGECCCHLWSIFHFHCQLPVLVRSLYRAKQKKKNLNCCLPVDGARDKRKKGLKEKKLERHSHSRSKFIAHCSRFAAFGSFLVSFQVLLF